MTDIATMTAEELRNKAAIHAENARESFERCDTDGFLSQWASGLQSRLCQTQAEIVENGGQAEFWGLFDLEGNRIAAKLINGKFGACWALCDANRNFTGRFVPFCQAAGEIGQWELARFQDDDGELIPEDSSEHAKRLAAQIKRIEKRVASWEKKHGFSQRRELAPAVARIDGKGYGLSGSAWVATHRTDGGYPRNAKLV